MHEGDIGSSSAEKEKKKRKKKKASRKGSIQSNEIYFSYVNVSNSHKQNTLDIKLGLTQHWQNESINMNKLLHKCDEREHEFKEEIISMRAKLEESERIEEMMNSPLKEKEEQCERLEAENF